MSVENLSLLVMILMHCSTGTVVFLFCFLFGFYDQSRLFESIIRMGRKLEIPEKNHLTTLKQKFHVSSSLSFHMKL